MSFIGSTGDRIGDGKYNTYNISQELSGPEDEGIAARVCNDLETEIGYTSQGDDETYWKSEPKFKIKPDLCVEFHTRYHFIEDTFELYHNGIKSDKYNITGPNTFTIHDIEGHIWVNYVPKDPQYYHGDSRDALNGPGVIAELITPEIHIDHIIRCRAIADNLCTHTGYRPNAWIGGPDNNIRSFRDNILPGMNFITGEHIKELQNYITELAYHIDSRSIYSVDIPKFTSVAKKGPYDVEYINEIRRELNLLEGAVIDALV